MRNWTMLATARAALLFILPSVAATAGAPGGPAQQRQPVVQQAAMDEIAVRLGRLEKELARVQSDLASARESAQLDRRSLKLDIRSVEQDVRQVTWIMHVMGVAGVVAGIVAVVGLTRWARARMQESLDKAIYGSDATYRTVRVPSEGFDRETERLEWLGFKRILPYRALNDRCLSGLVIYKVNEQADVELLRQFLEERKPDRDQVGYVLYTPRRIETDIADHFENITFANSPVTLGHALFVMARGLRK